VSALAQVLRLIARWRRPSLPANIVLVASTIAGLALAGTAIAQPARNADNAAQDDRSDRIQAEENSIDDANSAAQDRQAALAAAPREFYVRINLPLFYNSNAEEFQSHGSSALEGNPQLELGWGRSFTTLPLKLAVKLYADVDRYANVPIPNEANEDELYESIKASYYDAGNDQQWSPFVSFKNNTIYDATFNPWTETKNDFAIGFDKFFNFNGGFQRLPASAKSRNNAVFTLGISIYAQRRLRTPGPSSWAFYAVPSVTYVPSDKWSISLFLNTRQRWFDSVSGPTPRRDFEFEPIFTVAYDPATPLFGAEGKSLPQFVGTPQIALQVGFERRSSNLPNKSYSIWTAGPVLTASWKF
jgi:hypothetical protein